MDKWMMTAIKLDFIFFEINRNDEHVEVFQLWNQIVKDFNRREEHRNVELFSYIFYFSSHANWTINAKFFVVVTSVKLLFKHIKWDSLIANSTQHCLVETIQKCLGRKIVRSSYVQCRQSGKNFWYSLVCMEFFHFDDCTRIQRCFFACWTIFVLCRLLPLLVWVWLYYYYHYFYCSVLFSSFEKTFLCTILRVLRYNCKTFRSANFFSFSILNSLFGCVSCFVHFTVLSSRFVCLVPPDIPTWTVYSL